MEARLAKEGDAVRWDAFVAQSPHGSFLQTWAWGSFLEATGQTIWRCVVEDNGEIKGAALVVERLVRFGLSWLYVPRGPVWQGSDMTVFNSLQDFLYVLAKERGAMFVRIDPLVEQGESAVHLESLGWQAADHQVQPQDTLQLDLKQPADILLQNMHSKHRYNIRLAERKGVSVRFSSNPDDIQTFLELASEVSARTSFRYHPDSYYRSLIEILGSQGMAEIAIAEYEGKPLAAHIMVYSGTVATYLHGASSRAHRELMASHLLYWKTIERAKDKECTLFDFYGVAPENALPTHPWAGVTKMKRGFGGKVISYMPAWDMPVQKIRHRFFSMVRRLIRR